MNMTSIGCNSIVLFLRNPTSSSRIVFHFFVITMKKEMDMTNDFLSKYCIWRPKNLSVFFCLVLVKGVFVVSGRKLAWPMSMAKMTLCDQENSPRLNTLDHQCHLGACT
jgi:hypothetical protein